MLQVKEHKKESVVEMLCNKTDSGRDFRMDNIRFGLIFLVVFGHLLETFDGTMKQALYAGIYTFHMPCFLFLSGYFAKSPCGRIVRRFLFPYIVFQVLYLLLDWWMFSPNVAFEIQFTTPYYHLWYLLVVFVYALLIPLIKTESKQKAVINTVICIGISILVGFDKTIGNDMSLSRMFVFLPFFVAGFYAKSFLAAGTEKKNKWSFAIPVAALLCMLVCVILFFICHTPTNVFLGTTGYGSAGGNVLTRLGFLVCGFSAIVILIRLIPNRKIPCISKIGANTFPVFVLHVFVQRIIQYYNVFSYSQILNILLAFLTTCLIVWLFSANVIAKAFKVIFN